MTEITASLVLFLVSLFSLPAGAWAARETPVVTIGYTASNHGETDPCG